MTRTLVTSSLAAAGLGIILLSATDAAAQACETEADCPQGFVCEVVGGSDCAGVACAEGEVCPEPEPCVSEEIRECVPGPCVSNDDCGEGLECMTFSGEECVATDVACAEGMECEAPEPVCEPFSESYCVPEWVGPCEADADCGEGFKCVASEICECSAGAAVPTEPASDPLPDGGTPEPVPVPEPVCDCQPTGDKYCEPDDIACEADADCPDGWTCEASSAGSLPCADPGDGSDPVCPDPVPPTYACAPPYWGAIGGAARSSDESGSYLTATPVAEAGQDGESDPDEASPEDPAAGSGSGDGGGCQITGTAPAASSAWWALALAGLALRRWRRR